MRTTLLSLLLLLTLGTTLEAAPRHRHHQTTTTAVTDTAEKDNGIEAYSDTIGNGCMLDEDTDTDADTSMSAGGQMTDDVFAPEHYSNPFSFFAALWGLGVGGVMLAILIMLIILLIFLLPIVLLVIILRYLINRYNSNAEYRRYAQACEQPAGKKAGSRIYDEYMWRQGIKTTAIGIGMTLMFWIWGSSFLASTGVLILCIGLGKIFISRTSSGYPPKDDDKDGHTTGV